MGAIKIEAVTEIQVLSWRINVNKNSHAYASNSKSQLISNLLKNR